MPISSDVYKELVKELGDDKISTDELELLCYSYDSSPITGKPDVIVWPETIEDVIKIIDIAREKQVPMVPRGSGTSIEGSAIPEKGGIVVHMARMRNFIVKAENGYVKAEAGCLIDEIEQSAADMIFPLATVYTLPKTIGGLISEGYSCIQGLGGIIENVERIRMVTPGKGVIDITRESNPSVRDIVGSKGIFGIIIDATLILRKVTGKVGFYAEYGTVEEAIKATTLLSSISEIVNMEIIDQKTVSFNYKLKGWPEPIGQAFILAEFKEDVTKRITEIVSEVQPIQYQIYENEPSIVWNFRDSLFASICRQNKFIVRCRVKIPKNSLPEFFWGVERISGEYRLDIGIYGNALNCEFYPTIVAKLEASEAERAIKARKKIIDLAVHMNSGESEVLRPGWRQWVALGYSTDDIKRLIQIKKSLDPSGIMNPGKI